MPADLRGRRRKRTTDTIRKAAIALVSEHGLENVTVEMIAEAAGISLRSFFNYFGYKEEALIPPPLGFSQAAAAAFVAGKGPLLDDLMDLVADQLEQLCPDRRELGIIMQLADESPRLMAVREHTFARYEAEFRALVARRLGLGDEDRVPWLIAAVLGGAFKVAMQRWLQTPETTLAEEFRQTLGVLPGLFEAG